MNGDAAYHCIDFRQDSFDGARLLREPVRQPTLTPSNSLKNMQPAIILKLDFRLRKGENITITERIRVTHLLEMLSKKSTVITGDLEM